MNRTIARYYWKHFNGAQRILDLGCGHGGLGRHKPDGVQVVGLDHNLNLLRTARFSYDIVFQWDLESTDRLPFRDASFDGVVAKDVLEHLREPWRTVKEITRILQPGEIILASVICERGHRLWSDYTHVRGFTMHSIRRMFSDAGLDVLAVWRMGAIPLTSRLKLIGLVPYLLRFPILDWIWTSSYEIKARKPRH